MARIGNPWGLEGLFHEQPLESLDARALEEMHIKKAVEGSQYDPDNVIGLAFGRKIRGKGELHEIYLTTRGLDDSLDSENIPDYEALASKTHARGFEILRGMLGNRRNEFLARLDASPDREYVELGREKILVVYFHDATSEVFASGNA